MSQEHIQNEFLKGNHRAVTDALTTNPRLFHRSQNIPWAIGSAVFLGDLERAEMVHGREGNTIEAKVAGRFFLGLGYTRRSEYKKARALFAENLRTPKRSRSKRVLFYIHQGLAFYRFFCGRYSIAKKHAQIAYENALASEFTYGEIFARDLLGHTSVNTGEVRLGIKHLATALQMAQKIGNGGVDAEAFSCQLRFKNLEFDLDRAHAQALKRFSNIEDVNKRMRVVERFSTEPLGILIYPYTEE